MNTPTRRALPALLALTLSAHAAAATPCRPPLDENALAQIPAPLLHEDDASVAISATVTDTQGRTHAVEALQIDYGHYGSGFLAALASNRAAPLRSGLLVRDGDAVVRMAWTHVTRVQIVRESVYLLQRAEGDPVTCIDDRRRWRREAADAHWSDEAQRLRAQVTWRDGQRGDYELVSDSPAGLSGRQALGPWAIRLAQVRDIVPAPP